MPELVADLFLSVDGSAVGTRSPGYFGFGGPELGRWIHDEMEHGYMGVMGRRTYSLLSSLPAEGPGRELVPHGRDSDRRLLPDS